MNYWLIESDVLQAMETAIVSGVTPTAMWAEAVRDGSTNVLNIVEDTANISISGVLTAQPDFFAAMFGGGNTTYADIRGAISRADSDANVKQINLLIDSPGGQIDGMFDTLALLQSTDKPIKATVSKAASAAYAFASQADEITATSAASPVGSIGIAATFGANPEIIHVTSTEAPKKRPDVTTEAGKKVVREELDAIHELFADAIATGRNTTVEQVNAKFGKGATLLASDALKRGMIDNIAAPSLKVVRTSASSTTAAGGDNSEAGTMDLAKLKAEHPDVYSAAVAEGVNQERDRVTGHLKMGKGTGAIDTAMTACIEGTDMTASVMADYQVAGMNRNALDDSQSDSDNNNATDNTSDNAEASEDVYDIVTASLSDEGEV